MVDNVSAWLEQSTGLTTSLIGKLVTTILFLLLILVLQRSLARWLQNRVEDARARYVWQYIFRYISLILAILLVGSLWLEGFGNWGTYLGLLTAALAIALRDLVSNFVGWIYILVSRPFRVGDRIQVGAVAGDVIDLSIFRFTLLEIGNWVDSEQSTGRVILVPNGKVFTDLLYNYESGYQHIWNEIPVTITHDSNWSKARQLLLEIANKQAGHLSENAEQLIRDASRRFMIQYSVLTPTVFIKGTEKGIMLTIRYLCDPRQRRTTQDEIWQDILQAFSQQEDIRLARV